ncbi:ligase-associated DNA damage response DEXH box helicase [Wenzhouxiangella marina]|uniref:Putative ATP-dependent helicase protein n=1 Tax=Wenzhouxiangella marina TaxID=1579979 RepID=A0A0K0XUT6_9GAMM|nr:ligase-associated DNA damage response DEXH box helicase [Wenzhouxiangella marina]AKS41387.1 Putative ATP-dependent helicase protein [Wenzhouxiangella marina]MBB6086859.1 ATP-dependent Lhr-like helicase [Wenzhouxiangella marina]
MSALAEPTLSVERLFEQQGWPVFDFQRQAWDAWARGESGLIHAPTGSGKTLAAWGGPLQDALRRPPAGLSYLWITPLRALATDTSEQLDRAVAGLGLDWRVATRTGDTSASERQRLRRSPPPALVTTPESLSLMLSYTDSDQRLGRLRGVIIDEWHELLGSKRGVLLELALARLRALNPALRLWGLSATLGNVEEGMAVLLGPHRDGRLIAGRTPREIEVETLLPPSIERFPWAGRTGMAQLPGVLEHLERARSTLLFTNTRSQAELWFQAIQSTVPWPDRVHLHHGSIDRRARLTAEERLRRGELKCVVATSSLDLGVDFSPVDQVIQIGSPKGIARLTQRAGRSGHQPGQTSRLVCVPTHALEILEIAAARRRMEQRRIEARPPLSGSLDVAAQHLVTRALGGGFRADEALAELRDTHAFARLDERRWQWLLDFICRGGQALRAYPGFRRVEFDGERYRVRDRRIAQQHRMSVGTITADGHLQVRFSRGGSLGQIEERFITRLKPGERFVFAGRLLSLSRVQDMTAYVRKASGGKASVPRWAGGRLPLSTLLADAVLELMDEVDQGEGDRRLDPIRELLQLQQARSALPGRDRLLIETIESREGHHLYLFPFAGRLAHEGLAALLAWRLSQRAASSFSMTVNDYGIELVTDEPFELEQSDYRELLSPERLDEELIQALNATEMARHRFRDIARIAGLVFQGYPGRMKRTRQIQASSGLMFDMLSEHDPDNLLLDQARREVLEAEMELSRLRATLERAARQELVLRRPGRLTPLAFPLWADRLRSRVSSEDFERRVERMLAQLEPAT